MSETILVVAVYDVADNGRRRRLFQLLKRYGLPVQKSAFEGKLTTRERQALMREATKLLDNRTDKLTLYPVAAPQVRGIQHLGAERPRIDNPGYYLV